MKGKGGKPEENDRTREQTMKDLIDLAKKAKEHIINKEYEKAAHPLADELKKFSQVTPWI